MRCLATESPSSLVVRPSRVTSHRAAPTQALRKRCAAGLGSGCCQPSLVTWGGFPPRLSQRSMQQRRTSRLEDGIDSTSQDSAQAGTSSTHTSVKQDMEDPKIHGSWQGSMAERMKHVRIMGLQPSPELLAISMVYCVQGILGLSRLALSFFFKDELQIEPAQAAFLMGLSSLPWMIKPLYGFISDSVPLFGYRRRSYLVACGILGASSWALLASWVDSPQTAVAAMILASLSTAFSDVVVDSIVVERSRGAPPATQGSLQSLCWASAAVGGIASAYFSGSLVQDFGPRFVFGLTSLFPLVVSGTSMLITELPISRSRGTGSVVAMQQQQPISDRLMTQGKSLWSAISKKEILLPTAFLFMWQTAELGFTPEFLGRVSWGNKPLQSTRHLSAQMECRKVRLAGSLASLAGVALYNTCFKNVAIRDMLFWAMILGVTLGSTTLILIFHLNRDWGLSDQLFMLGDSVILTVLGQVSFMPILVLAARLCPEGVEATLFATLMSISNAGSSVGSALGAALTAWLGVTSTNFDNLALLVVICTAASLLPAPFLGLLPKELQEPPGGSDGKDDDDQGGGAVMRRQAQREDRLEMKGLLDEVERGTTPTPR